MSNYIELFMADSGISRDDRFAIKGCKKYSAQEKIFYFNKAYRLRGIKNVEHNSILMNLLAGVYTIVK